MKKEKSFLNIITYAPLFFIPLFVSIMVVFSYQMYSLSFDSSIEDLKKDILQSKKEAVENRVKNLSELILHQKSRIEDELINRVKGRVETAHDIARQIYDEYKNNKSTEEIKDIINTTLKTFNWNGSESYIWVMDYYGVHYLIEHKKDLKGTSYIDFQDAEGRFIIQEEISICKEKGQGYLWDTFTKPNDTKQYKQVAYVKSFEPYDWCFGSAEFLDTATKKKDKFLFDMVSNADKLGSDYVVIVNNNGDLLVHNKLPQFVGRNVEITDKFVLKTIEGLRQAIKDKEYASHTYDWKNFTTNQIEKKYAYIYRIPNTDWIIASGFFLSEIENKLAKQKVSMLEIYHSNTNNILYIAILIIFVSLLFSFLVSRSIRKRFTEYERNISEKNQALGDLNTSLEKKVQHRTDELEKIKNDFEKLATTDALTHIHNRYSIMKVLAREISRANRHNTSLSLLMYDIDYFKIVNDNHGHDIGDKVLVSLSELISKNIRDIDYVGRYGGEEFMVIMPDTSLQDASIYGERLREAVEVYHFTSVGKVTISIGIAQLKQNENIDTLFKRVDELLYISKSKGRNRVSY